MIIQGGAGLDDGFDAGLDVEYGQQDGDVNGFLPNDQDTGNSSGLADDLDGDGFLRTDQADDESSDLSERPDSLLSDDPGEGDQDPGEEDSGRDISVERIGAED